MDFIAEVVSTMPMFLVTQPLSLAMRCCITVVRSLCAITQTWMDLSLSFMLFQLNIFWKSFICSIGILTLPLRAIIALRREKMMEMRLNDIQIEVEDLIQNKRKLDQRLQTIVNRYKYIQEMYLELEDEHDEAVCKLQLLQGELENLKIENQRLEEGQNKALSKNTQKWKHGDNDETSLEDIEKSSSSDATELIETGSGSSDERCILELKRKIAVSQSGFSLLMSVSVGFVVLQAKDHCMPLLAALLVATMISLKSVLKYFSTIKKRPANTAVALLGLNCFMLGALTCPMLPTVASFLSPLIFSVSGKSM